MQVVLSKSKWGYHLDSYSRIVYLCLSVKKDQQSVARHFRKKYTLIWSGIPAPILQTDFRNQQVYTLRHKFVNGEIGNRRPESGKQRAEVGLLRPRGLRRPVESTISAHHFSGGLRIERGNWGEGGDKEKDPLETNLPGVSFYIRSTTGISFMRKYKIKELFYTLQGEGAQAGRPAVFCRFSGCNLWSGREQDRHKAICQFCDTDFWGTDGINGGTFDTPDLLAKAIAEQWPDPDQGAPYVVCTGGEPLLQLDEPLIAALHDIGFEVAVETNGTIEVPEGIDWICVSPKAGAELVQQSGHELKLVYPQPGAEPAVFANLNFDHFYLQPMDSAGLTEQHTQQALAFCLKNPQWRLSIQTHKVLQIP